MSRPRHTGKRRYPRELRLNELLRQIIASELERIDDVRLELVGITEVSTDRDLTHCAVYVSTWDESRDEEVLEALAEHRHRLQKAIANEARLRRTPPLHFQPDETLRSAERINDLLRDSPPVEHVPVPDTDGDPGTGQPQAAPPDASTEESAPEL